MAMITAPSRADHVQEAIRRRRLDAFYVDAIRNVRYLSGFTGSTAFIVITGSRQFFVTDFRYQEQAAREVTGFEIVIQKGKRIRTLRRLLKKIGAERVGFETSISFEFYELLTGSAVTLVPMKHLIENLRRVKDASEIESIQKAVARAEQAFSVVKPRIRVGVSEREIALRLEEQLKRAGCRTVPFDIIVASGENASMPHAKATGKKIGKGDLVTVDWGGEADGYCSDMTRTLLMPGESLARKIQIYGIVNDAREKAIRSVRPGMRTKEIDRIARDTIRAAGYGKEFGHGTGHGVGLDVHELPYVSPMSSERVSNGMVFTIEPGIYMPGLGGVRIEDMVAVKDGKAVMLTSLSREIEIAKR